MCDQLIEHIQKFTPLSAADTARISAIVTTIDLKKKDHLLKEGQICQGNYFVVRGLIRRYYVTEQGIEHTKQFALQNWWITDFESLEKQTPSSYAIQAVESSSVAMIRFADQEQLFAEVPALERYFRLIWQRAYAASLLRIHYLFDQSGEERYHHFNRLYPEFVQRIPQYMLASYLGFTPEFLSKIRAKKS